MKDPIESLAQTAAGLGPAFRAAMQAEAEELRRRAHEHGDRAGVTSSGMVIELMRTDAQLVVIDRGADLSIERVSREAGAGRSGDRPPARTTATK